MKKITVILERIKTHLMAKNDREMRDMLKIARGTLDTWKKNDEIPESRLIEIGREHQLSIEWLKTGKGEKRQADKSLPDPIFLTPELTEKLAAHVAEAMPTYGKDKRTIKLCTAFDTLEDEDKEEVLKEIMPYIIKRF